MHTLITFYYFLWVFPLYAEICAFNNPDKVLMLKNLSKEHLTVIIANDYVYHLIYIIGLALNYILLFIGFWGSQWMFCLCILFTTFVFQMKDYKSIRASSLIIQLLILGMWGNKFILHYIK